MTTMATAKDKIDAAREAVLNRGTLRHVFSISPVIVHCLLRSAPPLKPRQNQFVGDIVGWSRGNVRQKMEMWQGAESERFKREGVESDRSKGGEERGHSSREEGAWSERSRRIWGGNGQQGLGGDRGPWSERFKRRWGGRGQKGLGGAGGGCGQKGLRGDVGGVVRKV